MKVFAFVALVLVACGAGYVGSLLHSSETPEAAQEVNAAPPRAKEPIRIALVNLEEASRQSKVFKKLKLDWEGAQDEIKKQNETYQRTYERKLQEVQRARLEGDEDAILTLKVELQALEETGKAAQKEQEKYMTALLAQFQKDVLVVVMDEIAAFCKLEGYDMVLQDYSVESQDADFFSGGAYAQSLMSKPVLMAPGIKEAKNAYVIDITQAIINRVK